MKSTFGPNDENGVECDKCVAVEIGYKYGNTSTKC